MKCAWYMVPSPSGPATRVRDASHWRLDVLQAAVGLLEGETDLGEGVGQVSPGDQLSELGMLRVAVAEQLIGEPLEAGAQ